MGKPAGRDGTAGTPPERAAGSMTVAIIDYGSGNLHSAEKAFERAAREAGLTLEIKVTPRPEDVLAAERIVLPGVGAFDTELVREFFQAFAGNAGLTLHIETLYGLNSHHIAESCFKGVARALKAAVAVDPRQAGAVPSTKGAL